MTLFALPPGLTPLSIAAGSDGNLWFTQQGRGKIGRITPSGLVDEFATCGPEGGYGCYATSITGGPDGNLWFVSTESGPQGQTVSLNTFSPALHAGYRVATLGSGAAGGIAAGRDGNLWVAISSVGGAIDRIARVTTSGAVQALSVFGTVPQGVTAGPDGALWFTEYVGNRIGRIALDPDPVAACLAGSRFCARVSWQSGSSAGTGQSLPLTDSTGAFWFFSRDNVELAVKVLDGRSVNGKWWVFYGSLTNTGFTLTVTDVVTGTIRTYTNPEGHLASVADTSAF